MPIERDDRTCCPSDPGVGVWIVGIQNEREWVAFCGTVLRHPDLASDARFDTGARRVVNRAALHTEIDDVFGRLWMDPIPAVGEHTEQIPVVAGTGPGGAAVSVTRKPVPRNAGPPA